MEKEYFVILPGLSSPHHEKYKPTYDLLKKEAESRGFIPLLVTYPGQIDELGQAEGILSPECGVKHIIKIIESIENKKRNYRLFGISAGCIFAMSSALNTKSRKHLTKITLWGILSYWLHWRGFAQKGVVGSMGKGTQLIDNLQDYFTQIEPLEYLVEKLSIPVHIALGASDPYETKGFLDYLFTICQNLGKTNYTFSIVQGCGHNVNAFEDKNWKGYLDIVFS